MRKFEQRRQLDSESVVEFEQALRSLYRVAWPKATPEQKEVALKTRFEEGLVSHDMQQFLRLHALGDTFANTVQKARRFAATTEVPRTRKSVRITTPPAHEAVQLIKEDSVLEKRLDKTEDMIQSLQVTGIGSGRETPPPISSLKQPQRQFPTSRPSGEVQDRSPKSSQNRRQFVRPFNANVNVSGQTQTETDRSAGGSGFPAGRGTQNQKLVRAGVSGRSSTQRAPGVHQESVGFADNLGAILGSMKRTVHLHPHHGQERLTSVGRVANRGVGLGTTCLVHQLQSLS